MKKWKYTLYFMCYIMEKSLALLRGAVAKIGNEIAIEGGVFPKATFPAYSGGLAPGLNLPLGCQQTLFQNVLLGGFVQHFPKDPIQIAGGQEKRLRHLLNALDAEQIVIDIVQHPGQDRRFDGLLFLLSLRK